MYSFSSFLSSFRNFGQAKADVADAKEESSSDTKAQDRANFLARRNHGGPGTGDKFGRYKDLTEYKDHVTQGGKKEYTNSFVERDKTPTYTKSYTDNIIGKPLNYENSNAYKRAYAGYSTKTIFSSGISRLGNLSSLFNSVIKNPFGNNNNKYGGSRWT